MVERKIKWTLRAIQDKLGIYEYWIKRNNSVEYPEKLERLFNKAIKLATIFPTNGIPTEIANVRIKIVRNYKLVYRIQNDCIEILTVWDSRRDPKDLKIQ